MTNQKFYKDMVERLRKSVQSDDGEVLQIGALHGNVQRYAAKRAETTQQRCCPTVEVSQR